MGIESNYMVGVWSTAQSIFMMKEAEGEDTSMTAGVFVLRDMVRFMKGDRTESKTKKELR